MERSSDGAVPGSSKGSESPGKNSNASSSSNNSRLSRFNRKRKTAGADCSQILTPRKYFSGSGNNIPPIRMIPLNNVEEVRPKQVRIIVIESSSDDSEDDEDSEIIQSGEKTKEVNPSQKMFTEEVVVTVKLQSSNASKNKAVREDKTKTNEESEPKSSTSRELVAANGIPTVDISSSVEDSSEDDDDLSDDDDDEDMSEEDEDISDDEDFSESDEDDSEGDGETSESDVDKSNRKNALANVANKSSLSTRKGVTTKGKGLSSSTITIDIVSDDEEKDETNSKAAAVTEVEASTKDPPPSTITSNAISSEDGADKPTNNHQKLAKVDASSSLTTTTSNDVTTEGLPSAKEAMSERDKDETSNNKITVVEMEASSSMVTTNVVTTEDMSLPSSNVPSIEIIIEDGVVGGTSNKEILTEVGASASPNRDNTKDLLTANDMNENNQDKTSNKHTLKESEASSSLITTGGVNTEDLTSPNDSAMSEDDVDESKRNQIRMEVVDTSSSVTSTEDLSSANDSSNEAMSEDETSNEKNPTTEVEVSSSLVTTTTEVLGRQTSRDPSIEIIIEDGVVDETSNKEILTEMEASSSLITINGVNNTKDLPSANDSSNDDMSEDEPDKAISNQTLVNMDASSSSINTNGVNNTNDLSSANDSSNEATSEDETSNNEKTPTTEVEETSSSLIPANGVSSSGGPPQEVHETVEEIVNIVVNAEETNSNDHCTIEIEPGSLLILQSNTQVDGGLCTAVFCGESSSPTFLSTCYPMMNAEDMKRLTLTSDGAQNDTDKSTYRVLELTNMDQSSIHSAETPESFVSSSSNDSLVVVSDSAPPTPTRESPILTLSTDDMLRDGILAVMQEFDLI